MSRPVVWADRGFGITPMEQGLRVVGTVEFGGLENPLSKSRIKNLILNAKDMLNGLPDNEDHEDEWLGFRPTLPDFLPVIGKSKNYRNVYYSFGHHHLGWTLGAISGKIVSKMILGEKTNLDLSPYSSSRFFKDQFVKKLLSLYFARICYFLLVRKFYSRKICLSIRNTSINIKLFQMDFSLVYFNAIYM